MSYDLFFRPTSTPLISEQFASYFAARPHYALNYDQAFYENEDTGVYFCFEYDVDSIAFNLNYFRPHFFGLEAAPEVAAFISAFNLSIDDPQHDGMGNGPFTIEGFLRGWNSGNRFGYRALLSQAIRPETHVYPTADLERIWHWNFHRSELQNTVGDVLFVPKFMFMKGAVTARAAIVWPDACPIYLPKADLVFVLRNDLSPDRHTESNRAITIVEWADIESIVRDYPYDTKRGCFCLEYDLAPSAVSEFVRSLPMVPPDQNLGLTNDSVLNAELVAESTKAC